MDSEAIIVRKEGAISGFDELIRPDAFTPAVVVGDTQINRSDALERQMAPLSEMP